MSQRETMLEGHALCLVEINHVEKVVSTYIEVPATYTEDLQCDGGFYHDEGWFDYDLDAEANVMYPDEYELIGPCGRKREGRHTISKLIKVFEADLEERD